MTIMVFDLVLTVLVLFCDRAGDTGEASGFAFGLFFQSIIDTCF